LFGIDLQTFYMLQAFVGAAVSMALIVYLASRWSTAYHRGSGFWAHVGYSYGLLLIATFVLFHAFLGSGKLERRNFFLLMVGLAAPWLSNALYT